MKLEVGMYVRTKAGKIAQLQDIQKEDNRIFYWFDEKVLDDDIPEDEYAYYYQEEYLKVIKREILKASNNIIDLIEPLDLMYIDINPNDGYGGIVVPRVAETLNELEKWKERFESGKCKLVYITTHEQIESMQYKVD